MPVHTCPFCDSPLDVPENATGLVHCPRCKGLVGVPEPHRRSGRADGPPSPPAHAGFPEGISQSQWIAAALAGGAALLFFFFSCCAGVTASNFFWGGH